MQNALKKGLGFGISSAVIATLAIIVGLHAGTNLKNAVIAAVMVIAFADSLADALAVRLSEAGNKDATNSEAWLTTFTAFLSKLTFALSFLIPIFLFNLHVAIWLDIIYGFIVLVVYSYNLAVTRKESIFKTISFHVLLAIIVISASHAIGLLIDNHFD